jgi:hypothetical protein
LRENVEYPESKEMKGMNFEGIWPIEKEEGRGFKGFNFNKKMEMKK